jgi:type III restriction enzyme
MAQAVEDRIVKAPLIVTKENDPQRPSQDPDHITRENVAEKYGYWLRAAVQRWKDHWTVSRKLGTKPGLFVMAEVFRVRLKLAFVTTETEVHRAEIGASELPTSQELLASITNKVIDRAKLPNRFAELYPVVKVYVASRCFGLTVDLESETIRSHLSRLEIQEGIATYLARMISELTVERRSMEFANADFRLSETKPFSWRRNLPPLVANRTVFNYVATYNDFERRFAQFLDQAPDVLRFASLGTTEQGESGTQFRVDYLKPSGAIGFYHPDWVVVQRVGEEEINWIIEPKGRVWEGTTAKDEAIRDWCARISDSTGRIWRYVRVNQREFDRARPSIMADLIM